MDNDFLQFFHIRPQTPSLEFLTCLIRAFGRIPYENVTKMLDVGALLAAPFHGVGRVQQAGPLPSSNQTFANFRRHGLGGTCFALVDFFKSILTACGFVCYPVMADRKAGPDTHCALIVLLDGKKYLVDPGFLIHVPILLNEMGETVVETGYSRIILVGAAPCGRPAIWGMGNHGGLPLHGYNLFTDEFGKITHRYTLKPDPVSSEEFNRHWQASYTWPGMNAPLITTVHSGKQIYFRGGYLRINNGKGIVKKRLPKTEWINFVKTLGMDPVIFDQSLSSPISKAYPI